MAETPASGPPAGFVDLTEHPAILVDLRYAGADNFTGRAVYGSFDRLLLHPLAADMLLAAAALLARLRPDLRLLVLDGLRPNRVQRLFWEAVRGTPRQRYVADPALGSVHAFGLAVDATLADEAGAELDLGTVFDDFTPLSEPAHEEAFVRWGQLTAAQVGRRRLLRGAMSGAGFHPIAEEWWHFDAVPRAAAGTYPRIE